MFRLSNVTGGILVVALLAGGVTVVKAAMAPPAQSSAQEPPTEEIIPTPEATLPSPEPTVEVDASPVAAPPPVVLEEEAVQVADPERAVTLDDDEPDEAGKPDNHGSVVSVAAHCPVTGRAHGQLVSSIAKDKQATVADAEAACAAALDD